MRGTLFFLILAALVGCASDPVLPPQPKRTPAAIDLPVASTVSLTGEVAPSISVAKTQPLPELYRILMSNTTTHRQYIERGAEIVFLISSEDKGALHFRMRVDLEDGPAEPLADHEFVVDLQSTLFFKLPTLRDLDWGPGDRHGLIFRLKVLTNDRRVSFGIQPLSIPVQSRPDVGEGHDRPIPQSQSKNSPLPDNLREY